MSNPWVVFVVTFGLIAVSAFFVAVEFALLAARRHRLEEAAERSTPARYALRSTRELSVLLAGSQLGITACTLALGATTKPAVHYWLTPVIHAWGAPLWVAYYRRALPRFLFIRQLLAEGAIGRLTSIHVRITRT